MISGELYNPNDPLLMKERERARLIVQAFNQSNHLQMSERTKWLEDLFQSNPKNLYIEPPFFCDYGTNITLGSNVYMNFNCFILDVSPVTIGDNAMLAPNVQIYTATHPLEAKARNSGQEYSKPISIGNNVWIGGNAVICPGVTLGNNVVVGAGSVVTKSFPDDVVIAGNPARIIKRIDND